jgi:hypothetical protein
MRRSVRLKFLKVGMGLLLLSLNASAQCSMCRASLENNVSNGDIGIAAGINFGILYLFAAPYTVIALIAFFWYRTSKSNSRNEAKRSMAR